VETSVEGSAYRARLQGRRGRTYRVRLDVPFQVLGIEGGKDAGRDQRWRLVDVAIPDGPGEWVETTLTLRLGRRSTGR